MTTLTLTQTRIRQGKWEGILTGHSDVAAPRLRAFGPEVDLDEPNVTPLHDNDNSWAVSVDIPKECLNEGVQSFFVENSQNGERLANFTIVAGAPVEDHIEAEVALLRAELDVLKKVVRRLSKATD